MIPRPVPQGFVETVCSIAGNHAANPGLRALLTEVAIPLTDIFAQNALMFEGENDEENTEQHASEWIAANRDLVDVWLGVARG